MRETSPSILVRAPNWLGDAVMCAPFLRRLRAENPEAVIRALCRPGVRELFESFPGLDGALTFEPGENPLRTAFRLRREKIDVGYVLPPSFSSACLFALAGIPERIGYATDFRSFLLTRALPLDERYHYVRRYLGLLDAPGADIGPEDLFFPAPKNIEDRKKCEGFLAAQGVSGSVPTLAVAPGSQAPARRWPSERFAEFIRGLSLIDWPAVLLLGSAADVAVSKEVEARCGRPVVNLCGRTDLLSLGEALRRCAALVTNESGMMHVAWAVGTPTVALAGPSEPRLTSPFGARVRVLQHREVPCVPCIKNECYRAPDEFMECMRKIEVEEVEEAIKQVMRNSSLMTHHS